jgi:4-hydroxybenzoate polyprenyltransferase
MLMKALRFLTSASLFLALDGAIIVVFGYFLYGIEIAPEMLLPAFLTPLAVYSLNKATDKAEDSVNRPETASRAVVYYVGPSIAAMVISLGLGASIGPLVFITLLVPTIMALVYSVRLSRSIPRLKEIVGVKSVVVAFTWAFTGCLLPASMHAVEDEKIGLVFIYIFIQVLVGTILFDVLDIKGDLASGVETIPIRLGRNRTRKLLATINSFLGLWLIYCLIRGLFLMYMPALIFGALYGYVLIWSFSNANCQRPLVGLMVDGEWLPIVTLMKVISRLTMVFMH